MVEFEKLKEHHLKEMYEIRFSVNENLLHSHQIQYLLREQALSDVNQGGGWICKIDNEFVGYGFGIFVPHPLIGGLFVKPEHQGKGIGTALLSFITAWFSEKGENKVMLTTDSFSKAVLFYKCNGWIENGNDEFNQLIMTKELNNG